MLAEQLNGPPRQAVPAASMATAAGAQAPAGGKLVVAYWTIRGLGATLRMMCEYAGVEYEARSHDCAKKEGGGFDMTEWFVDNKPGLKEKNALINLPYVLDGAPAPRPPLPPRLPSDPRPGNAAATRRRWAAPGRRHVRWITAWRHALVCGDRRQGDHADQRVHLLPRPEARPVWRNGGRVHGSHAVPVPGHGPSQRHGRALLRRQFRRGCANDAHARRLLIETRKLEVSEP